jgi:hypothetical protein
VSSHYERNIELRVFEDRVMRIVFEPEKRKLKDDAEKCK